MTTAEPTAPGLSLEPTACPLCGADEGEPAAVGTDFDFGTSADSFLALTCRSCGLVYLNPVPAPAARSRIYPTEYFAAWETEPDRRREARSVARRAIACCRGLAPDARLLVLASGGLLPLADLRSAAPSGWRFEVVSPHPALIEAARRAGLTVHAGTVDDLSPAAPPYDAILVLHALEHCDAPVRELRSLGTRLRPGGRLVILCQNVASAAGRRFGGRHWAGYDFPRHRALYGPATLRLLAERAGLAVTRLAAVRAARTWRRSAANLLSDWSAPAWMGRQARRSIGLASPIAAVAEVTRGGGLRGGWLEAVLARPTEGRS